VYKTIYLYTPLLYNKHMIRKQFHITDWQKEVLEIMAKNTGLKAAEILRRALTLGLKILQKEE